MATLKELTEQAEELINCGNSKEIAEGKGMMKVINELNKLWHTQTNTAVRDTPKNK